MIERICDDCIDPHDIDTWEEREEYEAELREADRKYGDGRWCPEDYDEEYGDDN